MSMLQSRPTLTASNAQQLKAAAFKQQLPRAVRSCPQVPRCQAAPEGPPGFNAAKDTQDSYQFVYPFGWQEVSVDGTDVVYKDIIEPLESASVTISKTDKASVTEFGNPLEVAQQLTNEVLTPRSQQAKVLGVNKREIDGRTNHFMSLSLQTKAKHRYIRHALAVVTVGNGKFYTLTTGSNENRWSKMKERLVEVVKSFQVSERFTG
ncbi:MAG: OEE2 of thylakoid lumen [Trebouxia sp. A1-2]|nr:MAG: OEE2 of thylakoid lumen [Trebouxia sp. A1-2]